MSAQLMTTRCQHCKNFICLSIEVIERAKKDYDHPEEEKLTVCGIHTCLQPITRGFVLKIIDFYHEQNRTQ